jgi:hypothetical protein
MDGTVNSLKCLSVSRAAILNCTSESYEAQSPGVFNNRRQSKVTNDISGVIRGSLLAN